MPRVQTSIRINKVLLDMAEARKNDLNRSVSYVIEEALIHMFGSSLPPDVVAGMRLESKTEERNGGG